MTLEEFKEYYNFISATIERDDVFEVMINNSWKLSAPEVPAKPAEAMEI